MFKLLAECAFNMLRYITCGEDEAHPSLVLLLATMNSSHIVTTAGYTIHRVPEELGGKRPSIS